MAHSPEGGPQPTMENVLAENETLRHIVSVMAEDARDMREVMARSAERWTRVEALIERIGASAEFSAIAGDQAPEAAAAIATPAEAVTPPAPVRAATAASADGGKGFFARTIERARPSANRVKATAMSGVLAVAGVLGGIGGSGDLSVAHATGSSAGGHGGALTAKNNKHDQHPKKGKPSTRHQMVVRAESADTVAQAVKLTHSNSHTIRANLNDIGHESQRQELDHGEGSMNSLRSEFKTVDAFDAAEAVLYGAASSHANAGETYNAIRGDSVNDAPPANMTHEQVMHAIEEFFTNPANTLSIEHPTGTFKDKGQKGEHVFDAHNITLDGSQAVFTVTRPDGSKVQFLISNMPEAINDLCLNVIFPTSAPTPPTVETPPAAPAPPPSVVPPSRPKPPKKQPHHRHVTPTRPHPGVTTPTKPPVKPPHRHAKVDHSTSTNVAGVPGEPGGTGSHTPTTGPGHGGIEQPHDPQGFVPGENKPPAQPPEPTPAPIETTPAPAPPSPPETGQDNGGTPAPSSGGGTTHEGGPAAPTS